VIAALVPRTLFLMPALSIITSTAGWFLAERMGFLAVGYPELYWVIAAALYALSKVFEFSDRAVYANFSLSGHTIKHLLAAAACFAVLRYFETRRPIA
jgi:hypothetical protein